MIQTSRTVSVGAKESTINKPVILYRGDKEVEVKISLTGNGFESTAYGQLIIISPSGESIFSDIVKCDRGQQMQFTITEAMIDELIEVGLYDFQIRLYDTAQVSRATIPPVYKGFEIRHPITAEDETNELDESIADYSVVKKDHTYDELTTFLPDGAYNTLLWEENDLICKNRLNKIEEALFAINDNVLAIDRMLEDEIVERNQGDIRLEKQVSDKTDGFTRNLNIAFEEFKIEVNRELGYMQNDVNSMLEDIELLKQQLNAVEAALLAVQNHDNVEE